MLRPQNNSRRTQLSLNGLWRFRVQHINDHADAWIRGFETDRMVAVPASFNEQFTDYDTFNHMGKVWYSRQFVVPMALCQQDIFLHFDAVNYRAEVFLNGHSLGSHETGYTPFAFRINEHLTDGNNLLVVCVDCELTPYTVPQGGFDKAAIPGLSSPFKPSVNFDFFPYSGIHRSVSIVALQKSRIESLYVDTDIEGKDGIVSIRGNVTPTVEAVELRFFEHESSSTPFAIENIEVQNNSFTFANFRILKARFWDAGKPELYCVEVVCIHKGDTHEADSYFQLFGIRTVSIQGDKLLLNGKPIYLTGFGKHEDFPVLGRSHPDAVNVRDLELMKWIGANSFRTSHYPYAEEMLDLADRLGILVISESPAVSMIPEKVNTATLELHCRTIQEQMRRDYNHPSVIMWCVANEAHTHTEGAVPYFEKVFATARAEDKTRPFLLVMCYWPNEKCHHLCDIVGVNAYPGWYGGGDKLENTGAHFAKFLDDVRQRTQKSIMITEIGADCVAGFHSLPALLWTEDYQTDLLETNLSVIRSKDYIIGEHLWAFSDFHTAQNHFRAHGNRKGIFTRDRQPKASAHMLRKRWKQE